MFLRRMDEKKPHVKNAGFIFVDARNSVAERTRAKKPPGSAAAHFQVVKYRETERDQVGNEH